MSQSVFHLLADLVVVLHLALVCCVVGALLLTLVGALRHWGWVRNLWFRLAHLVTMLIIVGQSWLGIACPLTTLEQYLRGRAGQVSYQGDFVGHMLDQALFFTAPPWVFTLCYSAFGALVALSWFSVPPRLPGRAPRSRRA